MLKRIALWSLLTVVGGLPQAHAEVVADSGFRPKPHGFSFENWGGQQHPHSKLTPDDAAFLFGDQACARKNGDACVPTPGAKLWIDQMNKSTEGGHCEGMAVLSAAFYIQQESVDDFGAKQAFALKPDDEWLMRTISTYFTTQALEPVQSATNATRQWSLQQIVDHLAKTMKSGDDYPTLGIYGADGGHAITPYKIDRTGAGKYRIFIYDNNYPGAEKFIDVDVGRDEWIYSGAALNPKEDPAAWKGGAGSMDVTLLSTRYEPLKCPFCAAPSSQSKPKAPTPTTPKPKPPTPQASGPKPKTPGAKAPGSKPKPKPKPPKPQASAPKPKPPSAQPRPKAPRPTAAPSPNYTVYTDSRCSQVQAVGKQSKNQIKMGAAGVDSQIQGASMRPMRGTRGCVVQLPRDQEYDVRLVDDGRPSSKPVTDLTVFGSGQVYSVSNVQIRPNATETVSFSPTSFNYQAGGKQKPTVRVVEDSDDGDSYYEVSDFEIDQGHNFTAEEDDSGRIAFSDDDPELDDYDIDVEIVDDEDSVEYEFEDVSTGDKGQVLLDIDDEGDLEMDVDSDGDGEGNYYDEDDDNDGSGDEADSDDDNDGVGDAADEDYEGEDYDESDEGDDAAADGDSDEGDDDGSDDGEDDGAAEGSDDSEDEAAADDSEEGEDEAADEGSDESGDEAADDGSDGSADDESDDSEDDGADEDSADGDDDGGTKSSMVNDADDGSDDAEDEAASEDEAEIDDESEGEAEDEAAYEDEAEAEGETEDEAADEEEAEAEEEAAYEEEAEAEDEAAYEEEAEAEDEAAYEEEAEAEDEAAYEEEAEDEGEYEDSGDDE